MRNASIAQRAVTGAVWLMLWRFVTRSLGFVSTLVLARVLVPADFGLIAMATAFSQSIEALSQLGLQDALVRSRAQDVQNLYNTAFTLQAGRGVVTATCIALGAPVAAEWFHEPRLVPVLVVLALTTLLSGLENVGIIEYRRALQFNVQFKLMTLPRLVSFAVTIGLALLLRTYWVLLAGVAASSFIRTVTTYWLHPFRPRLRLARWRELAGFSFWTWATAAVGLLWERSDPFVLGPVLGPGRLGLYLVSLEVALLPVSEMIFPIADAIFAGLSRLQLEGTSSTDRAPGIASLLLLAILPVIVLISAASGSIVYVMLGREWSGAWPLVAIMAWSGVFSPFSYIGTMALIANGYVRRNFVAKMLVSAMKLAVVLMTVSITTDLEIIAGVTAATVAAESLVFLFLLRGTGDVQIWNSIGGIARSLGGAALSLLVVWQTGLGWQDAAGAVVPDLLHGALIGAISTATYVSGILLLWQLSGRPPGPERQFYELCRPRLDILLMYLPGWTTKRRLSG